MKLNLTEQELKSLANVIGEVEQTTSGEVRLMLVKRSAETALLPTVLWLALSVLGLIGLWINRDSFWFTTHSWAVPAVLIVSGVLAWPLAQLPWLGRQLLGPQRLAAEVWRRAELEFYREGLNQTRGSTGILIFLSQFERKAVVLADQAIASKLPESTWQQVVQTALEGRHKGWAAALEKSIRQCGAILSQHFPPDPTNPNELSNSVIIKD